MTMFRVRVKRYGATTAGCPACYSIPRQPCRAFKPGSGKLGALLRTVHPVRQGERFVLGERQNQNGQPKSSWPTRRSARQRSLNT